MTDFDFGKAIAENYKKSPRDTRCRICGKIVTSHDSPVWVKRKGAPMLWFHGDCYRKELKP